MRQQRRAFPAAYWSPCKFFMSAESFIMEPLPVRLRARLIANHRLQQALGRFDHLVDLQPLVRLFIPNTPAYWLVSELDPDDDDFFFGLSVAGRLHPHLGYGRFSILQDQAHRHGNILDRNLGFVAAHPLSQYLADARAAHPS